MRVALALAVLLLAGSSAAEQPLPTADFVLVDKSDRVLTLYAGGRPFRAISGLQLGAAPQGHKQFEGDERTPEGRYTIDFANPDSSYWLSLHVSYPNAADRAYAEARGRSPGGAIFIHGQPNWLPSAACPATGPTAASL